MPPPPPQPHAHSSSQLPHTVTPHSSPCSSPTRVPPTQLLPAPSHSYPTQLPVQLPHQSPPHTAPPSSLTQLPHTAPHTARKTQLPPILSVLSPDAERLMQGQVRPYLSVYSSMMKCLSTSVGSLLMIEWRRWTLLSLSYKTKCDVCLFPEMPFNTDTPNSTMSESDI